MNFLSDRTPRERNLIYGALAIVFLFAIWQFGVKSVIKASDDAVKRQASAARDLDIVRTQLPNISPVQSDATRAAFDRSAVIGTARDVQLLISRVQPGSDGSVQVWFEDSAMTSVYAFMGQLSGAYNVDISRVQISRQDNGRIAAQLTLKPIG